VSVRTTDVDVILDAQADVGESPTWEVTRRALVWVDTYRRLVHVFDPATGADRATDVGQCVGAAAPAAHDGLVLALQSGFALFDPDTGSVRQVAAIEADAPDALMNDGKCDPHGRFVAGSTTRAETPGAGALYRLNADCGVDVLLREVTLSNGVDWSPDGRVMYYVDSALQRIDTFRYSEAGHMTDRRAFAQIPPAAGMPDGLTVDADGYVWVALWGGSAVRRYSPDGELERELRLPVSQVTSCAFGGEDWSDLFITSANWGMNAAARRAEPHAGAIFAARPGVSGQPTRFFQGAWE
jgi:sugar lactone lactonase YvrE